MGTKMTKHRTVAVYDLATFQNGRAFKPAETRAVDGQWIIKIAEMNRGISSATGRFDGPVDPKFLIKRGDLLFAWSGSLVIQEYEGPPGILNQHIFKVTAKSGVDQQYLKYLLLSLMPTFQRLIDDQRTTMGHVKVADLKRLTVSLPPLEDQLQIAGVLRSLDDLIKTNRRLVHDMDTLMQKVFGQLNLHLPGDSKLTDLVELNPKVKAPINPAPYIDMASLPESGSRIERVQRREAKSGARFMNGDTLLARITPCLENGKTSYVDVLNDGEVGVGSTEFIVLRERPEIPQGFAYCLARSERFRTFAIQQMNGTSGRQRVSWSALVDFPTVSPNTNALKCFGELSQELLLGIQQLSDESEELERTRDTLLPLLISGRVRTEKFAA